MDSGKCRFKAVLIAFSAGLLAVVLTLFLRQGIVCAAPGSNTDVVAHQVVQGDTLWGLSREFGTAVKSIATTSGIHQDSVLKIGQILLIPVRCEPVRGAVARATEPTVKAAQTTVKATQSVAKATQTVAKATQTVAKPAVAASEAAQSAPVAAETAADPQTGAREVAALASRGGERGAVAVPWEEAKDIFTKTAQITDVRTGRSWAVVRRGGWAHADVEPATRNDTETMKAVWGSWSWLRRPVVVEVGEHRIAASMAGMPHGGELVTDNGVLGHFDLHFLNSTTHGSEYTQNRVPTVCPDHQAAVREAVGK